MSAGIVLSHQHVVYSMHVSMSLLLARSSRRKGPVVSETSWNLWGVYCVLRNFPPKWDVLYLRKWLHNRGHGSKSFGISSFHFFRWTSMLFFSLGHRDLLRICFQVPNLVWKVHVALLKSIISMSLCVCDPEGWYGVRGPYLPSSNPL